LALKISLKPDEKIFIGGAVVRNGGSHVELNILNDVPLLREKDILTELDADSLCKRIYLCVQLMYMDPSNLKVYQQNYRELIQAAISATPGAVEFLAEINNHLACGRYYQALKCARNLTEYEQGLTDHAKQIA
jgi:flagellar protein FlbT